MFSMPFRESCLRLVECYRNACQKAELCFFCQLASSEYRKVSEATNKWPICQRETPIFFNPTLNDSSLGVSDISSL